MNVSVSYRTGLGNWIADKIEAAGKCCVCGNPHLTELCLGLTGKVRCRQDIAAIADACKEHSIGWRVIDAQGRVISSGPGITMHVVGAVNN